MEHTILLPLLLCVAILTRCLNASNNNLKRGENDSMEFPNFFAEHEERIGVSILGRKLTFHEGILNDKHIAFSSKFSTSEF